MPIIRADGEDTGLGVVLAREQEGESDRSSRAGRTQGGKTRTWGGGGLMAEPKLHQRDVKDRRQEQSKKRHTDHAGKHRDAHGLAHLGASATRDDQREYARDKGDRGHEDRADTQPAS